MFTLLSRLLGFARDMVFAHLFGASGLTDAFFVAFKIPNFLRRLFAEGAFATAFVPVLTEYKTQREHHELKTFVDRVAGTLGLVLLVVSLLGMVAAPLVIGLFAFGWVMHSDVHRLALATDMLRLTFPYLFFISLTAFAGGILNSHNRFAVPAFTPVMLNLSLIGCALWLSPHLAEPVTALAWGVLIAGVTQFVFQLPFLHRLKLLPRPRPKFGDAGVSRILRLMLPALFAVSVTQINLMLDTVLASFLTAGSISWLYYSDRLMEFPLGVLGIALGTVLLPRLSQERASAEPGRFAQTLDWGLRMALLFGVPAALGLALLGGPMIATLFQSRAFDATDVIMSRESLIAYSVGLPAFIAIKVLAPAYYAHQDTRTPVGIAVRAMVANMVLNLAFIYPLHHAGLALATSLAAWLNAGLLWRGLRRNALHQVQPGWPRLLLQVAAGLSAMGLVLWLGSGSLQQWLDYGRWERAGYLALWIGAGAGAYLMVLLVTGVKPAQVLRGVTH